MSTDKKLRINQHIKSREIRLIDAEGTQVGLVKLSEALAEAERVNLDLVEINPQADPPVCKIMDYGKHVYRLNKKLAEERKKQKTKQFQIKEFKYRPSIEEGDYQVRLRKIMGFLEDGHKVKITVRFRGREVAHNELGFKLLQRIKTDVVLNATIEQEPKFEGRQIVMLMGPKKK